MTLPVSAAEAAARTETAKTRFLVVCTALMPSLGSAMHGWAANLTGLLPYLIPPHTGGPPRTTAAAAGSGGSGGGGAAPPAATSSKHLKLIDVPILLWKTY